MIELPLISLGGLLGSAHCVGMCGGFAISIGVEATAWRSNLMRQLCFGFGRIFTYVVLGVVAGYGGRRLMSATTFFNVQAALALLTGTLLIVQGMNTVGLIGGLRRVWKRALSFKRNVAMTTPQDGRSRIALPVCMQQGLMRSLLTTPGPSGPFLAGVLTGFLPCGLVYAMLALAAAGGSLAGGAAIMAAFGAGTLPMMTAFGLGASIAGVRWRSRMLRLAAWCVVAVGVLTLARGASAWHDFSADNSTGDAHRGVPSCPLCSERSALSTTARDQSQHIR